MNNSNHKTINDIQSFQEIELQKLLQYLNQYSTFYKNHFAKHNIDINAISLATLSQIPTTTKEDIQQYNWDFLCVDKSKIAEYCTTSGTLGSAVTIAQTKNDLLRLAYNEYLSYLNAGCSESDIFQLMLTLDRQFMAGIAYYNGIQKLGASVIRVGPGNLRIQIDAILNYQPTVLIAVPSFILKLIEFAENSNVSLNTTSVKKIICIGEAIRNVDFTHNVLASKIKNKWNVELYSTYASTEKQTAFTECALGNGTHAHPDLLYFEILDDQDNVLPSGNFGELTITTFGIEGMPLLRYKTGDICCYYDEPCACGRNSFRISPIIGRKQHLIKYKGTTVYPSAIINAINNLEYIDDYFIKLTTNEFKMDEIEIDIAFKSDLNIIPNELIEYFQATLRVLPKIVLKSKTDILNQQTKTNNRKLIKIIDLRT
ncbi:MAG: AMP-binding protein [Chitinophagales bacterium]|nr:AMP-binding protein [Chitinophagales bacterium]